MSHKAHGTAQSSAVRAWYKTDNAANIYCFAKNKNFSRTFRNSVTLDEDIDIAVMQEALNKTVKRFPTMNTVLRSGMFWGYLERLPAAPVIEKDIGQPCRYIIHNGEDTPCLRVSVYKNRLSTDIFHGVSDGRGTFSFLTSLIATYYMLKGVKISSWGNVPNTDAEPSLAEVKDSYFDIFEPDAEIIPEDEPSVYLAENNQKEDWLELIHGRFPVDEVKAVAKSFGLTLTEYLCAGMILMYIKCSPEPITKPIKISVPVDLRRRFPSETMRNFVFMTDVTFNPQGRTDVTFEEISDAVRGMASKKTTREYLRNAVNRNVSSEVNPITSAVPYPIKKLVMTAQYKKMQYSYTTILSNIGVMEFPPEVAPHVLEADVCLGKTPFLHFGCAAVSLNGIFNITFSSANEDVERQKFFFRLLASHGIHVRIDCSIR